MIFIVGPTATGKTKLALNLAQTLNADILSADSRQLYQGLEVTTGVDLPTNFSESQETLGEYQFFTNGQINLYGVSFLKQNEEWSIAHFRDYAELVWQKTVTDKKQLIIVGGSGLYHHSLFLDKSTLQVEPSKKLREELQNSTIEELQTRLIGQYPQVRTLLNDSDWQNPRRLMRWIEKTSAKESPTQSGTPSIFGSETDHTWIGLSCNKEILEKRIWDRVERRIETGAIREVELLLANNEGEKLPSLSTLGVKDIAMYINNQISKEELLTLWSRHEFQYAKRQITWFKKREYINWIDMEEMFTSQMINDILNEV
ncbi:MAG: tRNA (adenosine(37)-N6)-dimethylallyltransferase MiaA [Patescibacteria group bacterium]